MSGIQFSNMLNSPISRNSGMSASDQNGSFSDIFRNAQGSSMSAMQRERPESDAGQLQRTVFNNLFGQIDQTMSKVNQQRLFRSGNNPNSPLVAQMGNIQNQENPSPSHVMNMQQGLQDRVSEQAWQLQNNPSSKSRRRADRNTQSAMTVMVDTIEEHGIQFHIDQLLAQLKKTSPMTNSYLMTLANIRHLADKESFSTVEMKDMNMNPIVNDKGEPVYAQDYLRNRVRQLFPNSRFSS